MNSRDIDILEHIICYCDDIEETNKHFGNSFEVLESNRVYKNALTMCILQIGELAGHLSEEFKIAYPNMPWSDLRKMRDLAAHHYIKFDEDTLWETIVEDIPVLREYCEKVISQQAGLEQEALPEQDEGPKMTF